MKSIKLIGICAFVVVTTCLAGVGCKDDAVATGGPVDGSYSFSTWTCGTTDLITAASGAGVTGIKATVSNATGTQTWTPGSGCTATEALAITYSGSTLTITEGAQTCSASCSGAQCTASAAS